MRIYRSLWLLIFGDMERCVGDVVLQKAVEVAGQTQGPRKGKEGAALIAKLAGKLLICDSY